MGTHIVRGTSNTSHFTWQQNHGPEQNSGSVEERHENLAPGFRTVTSQERPEQSLADSTADTSKTSTVQTTAGNGNVDTRSPQSLPAAQGGSGKCSDEDIDMIIVDDDDGPWSVTNPDQQKQLLLSNEEKREQNKRQRGTENDDIVTVCEPPRQHTTDCFAASQEVSGRGSGRVVFVAPRAEENDHSLRNENGQKRGKHQTETGHAHSVYQGDDSPPLFVPFDDSFEDFGAPEVNFETLYTPEKAPSPPQPLCVLERNSQVRTLFLDCDSEADERLGEGGKNNRKGGARVKPRGGATGSRAGTINLLDVETDSSRSMEDENEPHSETQRAADTSQGQL